VNILLRRLLVKAHLFLDILKSQLLAVVEQVKYAHLVGGRDELVGLGRAGNLELDYSISHGEIPF
jgi:hypothetical protein